MRNHPGRFGHFAIIPLPNTDASLREIEYAYSVLKADGITLLTSYYYKWLGHPDYQPVFEELNRRRAVVFVHPTIPRCCFMLLPYVSLKHTHFNKIPPWQLCNSKFLWGTFAKFRDIQFIFTHAGAETCRLALVCMHQYGPKNIAEKAPDGIEYELRRLYYDIAGTAYRPAIAALTSLVPMTQDPVRQRQSFVPLAETAEGMTHVGFSAADLHSSAATTHSRYCHDSKQVKGLQIRSVARLRLNFCLRTAEAALVSQWASGRPPFPYRVLEEYPVNREKSLPKPGHYGLPSAPQSGFRVSCAPLEFRSREG